MRLSRPYLAILAFLALVGVWLQWTVPTGPASTLAQPQHSEVSNPPATRRNGVFANTSSPARPAAPTNAARGGAAGKVDPSPAPFAFLGRFTENGEAVVLLHRAGRTLKVRRTGPVADDYEVDALLENLVLLRHAPSGTQQVIEMAAHDDHPLSGSPEEFPRD